MEQQCTSCKLTNEHVTKIEEPPTTKNSRPPNKGKVHQQHIETLNPSSAQLSSNPSSHGPRKADDSDDEDDMPTITPVMKNFASLPSALEPIPLSTDKFPPGFNPAKQLKLDAFDKMFQYLGSHKELLRPDYGTSDALLVQAFEAQMAGQKSLARMCTEKALLIQYCNQLGKDGVSLFFQRYVHLNMCCFRIRR